MMISPEVYIEEFKDKTYKDLLQERNELLARIQEFENNPNSGKNSIIVIEPSPEVRYQCNLQYLGELCKLISEKYNEEYIKPDGSKDE